MAETTDAIEVTLGSCIDTDLVWDDENGPVDLTGFICDVYDAWPEGLKNSTVSPVDPSQGVFNLKVDAPIIETLREGKENWLRVRISSVGVCPRTTPRIWIRAI